MKDFIKKNSIINFNSQFVVLFDLLILLLNYFIIIVSGIIGWHY